MVMGEEHAMESWELVGGMMLHLCLKDEVLGRVEVYVPELVL